MVPTGKTTYKAKALKRINNIFESICSIENLHAADKAARKGKRKQSGVVQHDLNRADNILKLHELLLSGKYATSTYSHFKIHDPKERLIHVLPYYPDRIVQHAILNVIEQPLTEYFNADTYACIKGRGIHLCAKRLKKALRNESDTQFCLKLDIKKFYPSVDNDVLKSLLRKKFKDEKFLNLIDGIIDSSKGLPIGNYLSQFMANFYLSGFDRWLKQTKRVAHYFRYADDIVILGNCKNSLHKLLHEIIAFLFSELNLQVKSNYQIFPVAARGIDFVGYKFYHSHTRIRKTIKKRYVRMTLYRRKPQSLAAYNGWLKHCNSRNLIKKVS